MVPPRRERGAWNEFQRLLESWQDYEEQSQWSTKRAAQTGPPAVPDDFAIINDPLEGALLLVGGSYPDVLSVVGPHERLLGQYVYASTDAINRWTLTTPASVPGLVPDALRKYSTVAAFRLADFPPMDLWVAQAGAAQTARKAFYLWTAHDQRITWLDEHDLRRALASPWLRRVRGLETDQPARGIRVR